MMRTFVCFGLLLCPAAAAAAEQVVIEAEFPGATADLVAAQVAAPLEDALKGLPGVRRVASLSRHARCLVFLDLHEKADVFKVRAAARERLAEADALPHLAQLRGVRILPQTGDAFETLALSSTELDLPALSRLANETVRPALLKAPGVVDVAVIGQAHVALRVAVDPDKIAARNLSVHDIVTALKEVHGMKVSAGRIGRPPLPAGKSDPPFEVEVPAEKRVVDAKLIDDVSALVLHKDGAGRATRLRDVARVEAAPQQSDFAGVAWREGDKKNNVPAVVLLVQSRSRDLTFGKDIGSITTVLKDKLPRSVRIDRHMALGRKWGVTLLFPAGANRERKNSVAIKAAERLLTVPGVERAFWLHGDEVKLLVSFKKDVREAVRMALRDLPDGIATLSHLSSSWLPRPGAGMDIVALVKGKDAKATGEAAKVLAEKMSAIKGVVDVHARGHEVVAGNSVHFDTKKAAELGVGLADVFDVLGSGVLGRTIPGDVSDIEIVPGGDAPRADDWRRLKIRTAAGKLIPIAAVARIEITDTPVEVYRVDGIPCVVVPCNVDDAERAAVLRQIRKIATSLATKAVVIEVE